ncbi:MAG: matrixin family metalloprotease [Gemmatimonadaceae bacterium]
MRRTDIALSVVVVGLAVFVAVAGMKRRPMAKPSISSRPPVAAGAGGSDGATAPPPGEPTTADSGKADAAAIVGDMAIATIKTAARAPARSLDQVRALIAETPGTYMADMVSDLGGKLVRWPDKRQEGLRIWVQTSSAVPNWDQRYAQMARDAFDDWSRDSELPLRFDFVLDSASSDIRVLWSDKFPAELGQRVGTTRRTTDQYGWLVGAEIEVAIHDSTGRTIPPTALAGIVRHEAGHALGMGHSRDQRTMMFPTELVNDIHAADRETLRLLYRLPPGLAR